MKVIKIGAEWCSGCLVMRPRWEKVEDKMPDLETEYYDYDEDKKVRNLYIYRSDKGICIYDESKKRERECIW